MGLPLAAVLASVPAPLAAAAAWKPAPLASVGAAPLAAVLASGLHPHDIRSHTVSSTEDATKLAQVKLNFKCLQQRHGSSSVQLDLSRSKEHAMHATSSIQSRH